MTKRITAFLIIAVFVSGALFAQTTYESPAFGWKSPEVMGQGGSFVANGTGVDTLFTNPAAFAAEDSGELALLTVNPYILGNVFDYMATDPDFSDPMNLVFPLLDQVAKNDIGAGASTGFGLVAGGLGIGFVVTADAALSGDSVSTSDGDAIITAAVPVGYSFSLLKTEGLKLSVGVDVRPMYRLRASITADDITGFMDGSTDPMALPAMVGAAVAFDAGVLLEMGGLNAGLALRDIGGTRFQYSQTTIGDFANGTGTPTEVTDTYLTPMTAQIGASYHLDWFLSFFVNPEVSFQYDLVLADTSTIDSYVNQSFLANTHIGVEVGTLGDIVKIRAGMNGGYFSAGMGLDLLFLEVDAALYSYEAGPYSGSRQNMAATLEASIAF